MARQLAKDNDTPEDNTYIPTAKGKVLGKCEKGLYRYIKNQVKRGV